MKSIFASLALVVFGLMWIPAARTAESASVAGKWHFVMDTPGGDRESDSILEQSESKVTGKWGVSDANKGGDPVSGTFADKKLALEFPINSDEGGAGTLKISGTLADDGTLSGTWAFQDYSGTFKATRTKEASK